MRYRITFFHNNLRYGAAEVRHCSTRDEAIKTCDELAAQGYMARFEPIDEQGRVVSDSSVA